MSVPEHELALLDELLAILEGTTAAAVDVVGNGFSVRVRRRSAPSAAARPSASAAPVARAVLQVKSPAVGIFSASREWKVGDRVEQGIALGGVQSLGQVAEIAAPASGAIREVLTSSGAPVEYGQPLFALEPS